MPKHNKIREDELRIIMDLKGKMLPSEIAKVVNRSKYTIRKIVYPKSQAKVRFMYFDVDKYSQSTATL